jgi:HK97 gp10 family phage protein
MAMTPKEFNVYLNGIANATKDQIQSAVNQAAAKCDAAAKEACPVDTGNLRSSIHIETGDCEATVGTNVEYASYVEFGTYKMKAQPYMSKGAAAAEEALPQK